MFFASFVDAAQTFAWPHEAVVRLSTNE